MTYLAGTVEKSVLVRHIHGFRLPQAAGPLDANAALVHFAASLFDLGHAITHVAAQRNVRRFRSAAAVAAARVRAHMCCAVV